MIFLVFAASCELKANAKKRDKSDVVEPNSTVIDKNGMRAQPIIIWHHRTQRHSVDSLRYAISSGLITHVNVSVGSRTSDTLPKTATREAIEVARKANVKVILTRSLWSGLNTDRGDIFRPDFYIREIRRLRVEAKEVSADFAGLDTEPWGRTPIVPFFKGKGKLSTEEQRLLKETIAEVVETCGKVDFLWPAGALKQPSPYDIVAELGEMRIAESTYFNNEKTIKSIKYPYEIFGAYVNTVREREKGSGSPYFLVSDIFDKSKLWSNKKGLFIYPKERKVLAVAKALVSYSKSMPTKFKDPD
jgi:hypothetical protein